jgi:uncharacterized membrane protein
MIVSLVIPLVTLPMQKPVMWRKGSPWTINVLQRLHFLIYIIIIIIITIIIIIAALYANIYKFYFYELWWTTYNMYWSRLFRLEQSFGF